MPEFSTTLTNDTITITGLSYSKGTLTISDYSNYIASTESGHLQANFTDYKKVVIILPDETEYIFSTQAGGDETIVAPSTYSSTPISHTYSYTDDGLYKIKLIAIPTWSNSATYQQYDCVYYNSNLYKAIQTTIGNNPETSTLYWSLITDEDSEISEKYYYITGKAILDNVNEYLADLIYLANSTVDIKCSNSTFDNICKNATWRQAVKIDNLVQTLDNSILNANITDFEKAEDIITELNGLCNCVES